MCFKCAPCSFHSLHPMALAHVLLFLYAEVLDCTHTNRPSHTCNSFCDSNQKTMAMGCYHKET